jgi:hypothetical protein
LGLRVACPFKGACDAIGDVRIHAACGINEEGLDAAAQRLGASEKYVR